MQCLDRLASTDICTKMLDIAKKIHFLTAANTTQLSIAHLDVSMRIDLLIAAMLGQHFHKGGVKYPAKLYGKPLVREARFL